LFEGPQETGVTKWYGEKTGEAIICRNPLKRKENIGVGFFMGTVGKGKEKAATSLGGQKEAVASTPAVRG